MNFVREDIQEADLVAFDLEGEDARQPAKTSSRRWVIDRSAGVSLRLISWFTGPEYSSKKRIWSLRVGLETVEVETETVLQDLTTAPAQVVYRLKSLKLPGALEGREDELIRYMKEALLAYGLGGRPDQSDRATYQLVTEDWGAP